MSSGWAKLVASLDLDNRNFNANMKDSGQQAKTFESQWAGIGKSISGAISAPLAEMTETAAARLAGHNLFVVYGDAFQDALAKAGAKRLLELGFKNVYVLEGGIRAWQKDGYTLVTGTEPGGGSPPKKDAAGIKPAERGGVEVPEQGVR